MFTVRWPSLPKLGLFSSSPRQVIDLPPVKIHETDSAQAKPARALKHLLKLNHVENGLFDCQGFPNQIIQVSGVLSNHNMKFLCKGFASMIEDADLLVALELLLPPGRRC